MAYNHYKTIILKLEKTVRDLQKENTNLKHCIGIKEKQIDELMENLKILDPGGYKLC